MEPSSNTRHPPKEPAEQKRNGKKILIRLDFIKEELEVEGKGEGEEEERITMIRAATIQKPHLFEATCNVNWFLRRTAVFQLAPSAAEFALWLDIRHQTEAGVSEAVVFVRANETRP